MDFFDHITLGFQAAFTINALLYCFVGCLLGTLIGVLPGLGPAATISMLLPATFTLEPSSALIMMAGIYYGAQYGGSTTAILVNLPGEATSVVTAIDGYQMARQGRAGIALATAAISSFIAGTIATLVIAAFAVPLGAIAESFGPAEYFSLMLLGLITSVVLAQGSLVKALAMVAFGLLLGMVGSDVNSGMPRLDFGFQELFDGINLVAVAMGVFGLAEIIRNLQGGDEGRTLHAKRLAGLMPRWRDFKAMVPAALRGTGLGTVLGILPGGGALLSSFASYALEKKLADDPSRFGKGAIEGVAGPEAANNAGAQTSFIPLLALGIPSNVIMALMAGALIIQGIQPGPGMMQEQPTLFWGLIASMWIGNLMLLVLNLPLVGVWAKLVTVPYDILYPAIMVFCAIGVFTLNNNTFDIYLMLLFGAVGYIFIKLDCEPAPMLLGMVLGPMMEDNLRRAMLLSRGDPMTFVERPISAALLALAVAAVIAVAAPTLRAQREVAFKE
ncbi:tripartite tricarboxylate transporter permease [Mesorhizobium sp. ANAO-SY3R2]|uniref:tripartite tricarboxylate transporter permease n=1 Tax=Mesorhizobium sp. ANAO-SY3R2 TaxID=3166644 RepID=UPI003671CE45